MVAQRLTELSLLESSQYHRSSLMPTNPALAFLSAPTSLNDPVGSFDSSVQDVQQFIDYRSWLTSQLHTLRLMPLLHHRDADRRRGNLIQKLVGELHALASLEKTAWEREMLLVGLYGFLHERETGEPRVYHTGMCCIAQTHRNVRLTSCAVEHLHVSRRTIQPFILIALIVTSAMHTLSGLNREAANLVLVMLRTVLVGAFISCNMSQSSELSSDTHQSSASTPHPGRGTGYTSTSGNSLTRFQQAIVDTIPRDVRTALKHLSVEPDVIRYASCPSCSQIYAPDRSHPDNRYPQLCSFSETDKGVCGSPLVRKSSKDDACSTTYTALRPYPYRTLCSWIADLFSRSKAEELVESAWAKADLPPGSPYRDILHAPALQNFHGPDGSLFSQQPRMDVHLVFGLFIDWFNPGGNKQAGKTRSVGAIYLVCLNSTLR